MNPFGLPNFQIPITINGITNKVWYFYWAKIGQTLANQVALPSGSYTNTNLTVNANGVISAISSGASGGVVTSIGSSTLTIAGTASVPTVDLSGAQLTDLSLGGTSLQPNGVSGTVTNANLTIVNGQITVAASGSGGSSLSLTDGTHTVSPTTAITASGLTVGGSTPNATLTYNLSDGSTTPIYTVANTLGAWTTTLKTQSANTVFAGPTTGTAAQPTFRSLVAADGGIAGFGTVVTTLTQAGGTSQSYAGQPAATTYEVICIGGGGGGGSGSMVVSGATACSGGAGGGGGAVSWGQFKASDLTFPLTVTFSSTTGGAGGVHVTSGGSGSNGTAGANVSFGIYLAASGGGGGASGKLNATSAGASGGVVGNSSNGTSGGTGANGGATSGGTNAGTALSSFNMSGGLGGGSGGGVSVGAVGQAGGLGGQSTGISNNQISNLPGGTVGSAGGGTGGNGTNGSGTTGGSGGGGGGGGATTVVGGPGGNGGTPGGGGGGGGACVTLAANSGAGGNGAPATCIIIAY